MRYNTGQSNSIKQEKELKTMDQADEYYKTQKHFALYPKYLALHPKNASLYPRNIGSTEIPL